MIRIIQSPVCLILDICRPKKQPGIFLSIFIYSLLLLSCKKENDIFYPKKYVFDKKVVGNIIAYTNSGEITNDETINHFISNFNDYFWQTVPVDSSQNIEIEIVSENRAKISYNDTTEHYNLFKMNGVTYFQIQDTSISFIPLEDDHLKYSPRILKYPSNIPSSIGINDYYVYIPCLYFIESTGMIYFPKVSFVEKLYNSENILSSAYARGNINNEFNTSYLNYIQLNNGIIDTIAYQDNQVVFKEVDF